MRWIRPGLTGLASIVAGFLRAVFRRYREWTEPRLAPPSYLERTVIDELRGAFPRKSGAAAQPTSGAEASWVRNLDALSSLVLSDDPRRFLRWEPIRRTMFVGNAPYIVWELLRLLASPHWSDRWRPALQEDPVGCPERFVLYPGSSGNLIHHAYHLLRFEEGVGRPMPSFDTIVEFGGGYGSMCRLMHRLGFRGRYVIVDLPGFSLLQRYFLRSVGLSVDTGSQSGCSEVRTVSTCTEAVELVASSHDRAFVATWSFSETPERIRNEAIELIRGAQGVLIGFQDRFEEIDNVSYFQWLCQQTAHRWMEASINHLPGNRYLFGSSSSATSS